MRILQYLMYLLKNYDLISMTKEDYQESYIFYYTDLLWGEISITNQLRRAKTDFIYASRNFPLLEPNQILEHYEEKVSSLITVLPQKKNFIKKRILANPPIHPRNALEMKK